MHEAWLFIFLTSRTSAILKIVKSPYLNEKSSDFDEIWYTTTDFEHGDSHVTKYDFFRIQDGVRPPYWKSFLAITQKPIAQSEWNFA